MPDPKGPRSGVVISGDDWTKIAEEWGEDDATQVAIPAPEDVGAIPIADTDEEVTPPARRCCSNCGMTVGTEDDSMKVGALMVLDAIRKRMKAAGLEQEYIETIVQAVMDETALWS